MEQVVDAKSKSIIPVSRKYAVRGWKTIRNGNRNRSKPVWLLPRGIIFATNPPSSHVLPLGSPYGDVSTTGIGLYTADLYPPHRSSPLYYEQKSPFTRQVKRQPNHPLTSPLHPKPVSHSPHRYSPYHPTPPSLRNALYPTPPQSPTASLPQPPRSPLLRPVQHIIPLYEVPLRNRRIP
ncbi:hypothetical protein M501DRAFT_1015718 [Patellaria atrata CBS 101060]|uniref:Uncharacterized protein n=1 Tax=Patellaria atrata CBS 101060 TaxID=1346257 RepID=A0A9P4VRQ0_9PEZI|nr:hypothetical protein M501DRAFT_1015718 [Patellaria atrata CBS 101060]